MNPQLEQLMNLGQTKPANTAIRDILVVDTDSATAEALKPELGAHFQTLRFAASPDQAVLEMQRHPADLLLVNLQIGDQRGLELVAQWRKSYPHSEVIALSRLHRADVCLAAWRAGASDLLFQPLDKVAVEHCLNNVAQRRTQKDRLNKRNERLRQTCRQLSKARKEIGAQVELLCHDLVRAYQDMAQQLHQTQLSGEYAASLGSSLDIESIMRATMQYVLKKAGPVNAAVFLPDSEKNYVLGAYLDLDTSADSVLIDIISQTIASYAARSGKAVEFVDDAALNTVFGQTMLLGKSWMAVPAYHRGEAMAVLVAFRSQEQPFAPAVRPTLESIAAVLGAKVARLVDIHNRWHHLADEPGDESGPSASCQ
jgi:DNA-binding response OmpR family regulator